MVNINFNYLHKIGLILSGSATLYAITPEHKRGSLGANSLGEGVDAVHPAAGIALEAILTMFLVLVVYSSVVDENTKAGRVKKFFFIPIQD